MDKRIEDRLYKMGIKSLTAIQKKAYMPIVSYQDACLHAKTGSGKTLAFVLPIVENLELDSRDVQVLVLAPTRELAKQIKSVFDCVAEPLGFRCESVTGKESYSLQVRALRQRVHVVVATPGRAFDLIEEGHLDVSNLKYVVLDEADELLCEKFSAQSEAILEKCKRRATIYVSATLQDRFKKMVWIEDEDFRLALDMRMILVDEDQKEQVVYELLTKYHPQSCILFVNLRASVDLWYQRLVNKGVLVSCMHAGLLQKRREQALREFSQGKTRVLVCTDVAGRGIDVEKVDLIIHVDLANTVEIFWHRSGRSARMHESGHSIGLVTTNQEERAKNMGFELSEYKRSNHVDLEFLKQPVKKKIIKDKDIEKLYISAGKLKKIRVQDIVGALCSIDGIEMEDLGVIDVQEHQSYVDILHGKAHLVLKNCKQIKKKTVRIERARSSHNGR